MGKVKKSTKKFLAKGGRPKAAGKPRQHGKPKMAQGGLSASAASKKQNEEEKHTKLEEMDVDEFLDGGFEDVGSFDDDVEEDVSDVSADEDDLPEVDSEDGDDEDAEGVAQPGAGAEESEDDDDAEDDQGDAVVKDNKRLRGEVSKHRSQLEALKAKDPEFYAYLQQTDADLLSFGHGEEDEEEEGADEEEESDEDEEGEAGDQKKERAAKAAGKEADDDEEEEPQAGTSGRLNVTTELVAKWCATVKSQAALGSMRQLVKAYRLACHYGDSEEEVATSMKITSSSVYNRLMMFMLKEADGLFRRMMGIDKKGDKATLDDLTKSNKWRKVGPLIKSFWGNSLHLLSSLTDAPLLAYVLRRLRASVLMLGPFKKLADKFLKSCLGLFGSSESVAPRVQSFLAIRQLAIAHPQAMMDKCLKGMYRTFLANAKFVSAASAPHIAFMSTCCVEMWGLDMQASYQHAFAAIRQLAQSLRGALNMKSQDAYKEMYSWQGINSLELWAKVLGAHADKQELRPLVYPLVQVMLGTARLVPTPRFFPLRLRLLRAINRLSQSTGFYVPVSPLLLEMLHWSELHKPPKGGAGSAAPNLSLTLRAGKNALKTSGFQEEVVLQVLEMLADHLAQWSCCIAFPEMAHLPLLQLRKFAKGSPVERFRRYAKQLTDAVDRNVQWVGRARDRVDFSPKDVSAVAAFLSQEAAGNKSPLQQFSAQMAQRAAQRAALRATSEVNIKSKRGDADDDDDEDDVDGGSEDDDAAAAGYGAGGSEQGDDDDDGEEEEDFAGALLAGKQAKKQQQEERPAKRARAAPVGSDEGGDDLVQEYELSDEEEEADDQEGDDDDDEMGDDDEEGDDEDEDEAPQKKSKPAPAPRQPHGKHQGGGKPGRGPQRQQGGKGHRGAQGKGKPGAKQQGKGQFKGNKGRGK